VGVSTATIGVFKTEEFCKRGYSPPKIFEPTRRQFCVTNGRLYRPMSQVALQRSRVSPFVSQDVAGRVSEHVRVNFKRHFGRDAGALDQLLQARYAERRSTFAVENKRNPECCAPSRREMNRSASLRISLRKTAQRISLSCGVSRFPRRYRTGSSHDQ
jgi:hypothetical protein